MSHSVPFRIRRNEFTIETAEESSHLKVHVLFTTPPETQAALKRAAALSANLNAETVLVVPHVVPFPLSLDHPAVPLEFTCEQIAKLAACVELDLNGHIYLCRDRVETILRVLNPHSLVVLGSGRHWIFSNSKRLARALRRRGHDVVLANTN